MGPLVKYPADLGKPPYEKYMLFRVSPARHIQRKGMIGEAEGPDRPIHTVGLYLPPEALHSTLSVDWSDKDVGAVGGAAISAFTKPPAPNTTDDTVVSKLKAAVTAGGVATVGHWGAEIAEKLLTVVSSGGAGKEMLETVLGAKLNPRTDMLFDSVKYRTHQFSFTLIPRNETEAKSIDEILSVFQFYMLPSFGATGEESLFIGYPYEFTIDMYTTGSMNWSHSEYRGATPSQHINKIDRSVLTRCTIDHSAGNDRVAFAGGQTSRLYYPAATSLELNFTEVRLQGRDEQKVIWRGPKTADNGGYDDPRGPVTNEDMGRVLSDILDADVSNIENIPGTDMENPMFRGPRRPADGE